MTVNDYARLGAKAKFTQNVEENRRIAQAYPGLDLEVKQEIQSQRMAVARAAKTTTTTGKRRGRKPGSKNKPKTGTTTETTQTQERRDSVDEISGLNG
jgi:hypothetical protein